MPSLNISLPDLIALAAANSAMHPSYKYEDNVAIREHVFKMAQAEVASWMPWQVFMYVVSYARMADGKGVGEEDTEEKKQGEEKVGQEEVAPRGECCDFDGCGDLCRFYPG